MDFENYRRIACILTFLELFYYEIELRNRFPDFYRKKEQMEERTGDIMTEYPDYCKDEGLDEQINIWLSEFCDQIADVKQQQVFRKKFRLDS